jgi:hypothetical protein
MRLDEISDLKSQNLKSQISKSSLFLNIRSS